MVCERDKCRGVANLVERHSCQRNLWIFRGIVLGMAVAWLYLCLFTGSLIFVTPHLFVDMMRVLGRKRKFIENVILHRRDESGMAINETIRHAL